ncbi:MAG TPA: hypothetical protein VGD31_06445, partial [Sphingobacteriaceae bacterium]
YLLPLNNSLSCNMKQTDHRTCLRGTHILTIFLLLLFASPSCQKAHLETIVYQNDFENNDLSQIERGVISIFNSGNGTKVLGMYNNGSFVIRLNSLPAHKMVRITFDLNIHDTWDGNFTGGGWDGPDTWQMNVNGKPYIYTTFSNSTYIQSYPGKFPSFQHPKSYGRADIPGACTWKNENTGTTQYKIEKFIPHTESDLVLECLDRLVQRNSVDPLCDESWSADNVVISIL